MLLTAAGQAAGSLVQPAADAGKGLFGYLKHKYDYAKMLHQNYHKLRDETDVLISREKDVNTRIHRNQAIMEPTYECACWLERVKTKKGEVDQLAMRYGKETIGSCGVFRLFPRSKLSKDILEMKESVVSLKDQMPRNDILVRKEAVVVQKKFAKKLDDVPPVAEHVDRLLNFLKVDDVHRIGILGMPGVGKTTIMKCLNDKVEKDNMFDVVIWVTVSKDGGIDQIQNDILERLNFTQFVNDSQNQKKDLIATVLKEKKYLLLLDEVYSVINLELLGIHESHAHGKVVFATRKRLIFLKMDVQEEYRVERLSDKDAWKLFHGTVGKDVDNPNFKPTAELILKQCGGLPQLIKAVGRYLKNKVSEDLLASTLNAIRSPLSRPLQHMDEILNTFRVLCAELADELKDSLLYSASFPEEHEIYRDYLIECWNAERMIRDAETFRKARESGHRMIEDLIDIYMFDLGKSKKYVKMPIIFQNAALRLACENTASPSHSAFKLWVDDWEELKNHSSWEKWRNARVISLIHTDIQDLPEKPECHRLTTLFLQNNETLTSINQSFLECMPQLKVLNLYGTGIEFLPPSISELSNLRALYLNNCHKLKTLPEEIERLTDLELLDISGAGMHYLPKVVGKLTHLRCLRASINGNHAEILPEEVLPPNTLDKLSLLEELSINVDPMDSRWSNVAMKIAEELSTLKRLTAISFYFPSVECLEKFWNSRSFHTKDFRSFMLFVGPCTHEINIPELSAPKYLQYSSGVGTPKVVKEVVKLASAFELWRLQNVMSLSEFGIKETECVEFCSIQECNEMTSILGCNNASENATPFEWLKELELRSLQKLNGICHGTVVPKSFSRLKKLTFDGCPNMKKIFSVEITKQLSSLQHLRVEKCCEVIEVIEDGASIETPSLPKLEILELVNLQKLGCIYPRKLFSCSSLQKIEINACNQLRNLSLCIESATKLQRIICREAWWENISWLNNKDKEKLTKICHFIKEDYNELQHSLSQV